MSLLLLLQHVQPHAAMMASTESLDTSSAAPQHLPGMWGGNSGFIVTVCKISSTLYEKCNQEHLCIFLLMRGEAAACPVHLAEHPEDMAPKRSRPCPMLSEQSSLNHQGHFDFLTSCCILVLHSLNSYYVSFPCSSEIFSY